MKWILYFLLLALSPTQALGQDSLWTLERCQQFARTANITIQQSELSKRVAEMQYQLAKVAVLPSVSLSTNYGLNFGRSIDPTSNAFVNTSYEFTGISASSNLLLFGWLQRRRQIQKADLLAQAAIAQSAQTENDVALNIAAAFLRSLLARQQINISEMQLELSNNNLKRGIRLAEAGRSNGFDVSQVQSQLATDSAIYFKALLAYQQAIIDIKAILSLDFYESFFPVALTESPDLSSLLENDPESLYRQGLQGSAQIKAKSLLSNSAKKDVAIAHAALYPQLNLGVSAGTNYSSTFREYNPDGSYRLMSWGKQLQNNFSQSVYLGLSIPLFGNLQSRFSLKQARVAAQAAALAEKEVKIKLRQDIFKAYGDAKTSIMALNSFQSASKTAMVGVDIAQKRFDKGLSNATDLLQAKNTLFRAQADEASAKYESIFKLIVLQYLTEGRKI